MWDTMKLKKVHVIKVLREEREEQKKNMRINLVENFLNLMKKQSPHPRNIMNSPKWHEHKEIHTQELHIKKKKKMLERQRKNLKKQQEKNDSIVLRIPVRLTDFGYWKQRRPEAELWMAYSKS